MFEERAFLYWSEIKQMGEITLTPVGGVQKSKYKNKKTHQDMWNIKVQSGGTEGYFSLDSKSAADKLAEYQGNEITVAPLQGKTEGWQIIDAPEPEPKAAPPAKRSKLTPKAGLTQICNAIWLAKKAVVKLHEQQRIDFADEYKEGVETIVAVRDSKADLQTIMIYMNSHGLVDLFPTDHFIWSPASKAAAQAAAQEKVQEAAKEIFKAKVVELDEQPEPKPFLEPSSSGAYAGYDKQPQITEKDENGDFVF